ncbi:uncharacterized protein MONOS_3142 [Monocercomonoides exilis]|uniref:uncharacterized protein n=1 Tax=Monocercomonoides exilis TaxID=2049356 RepID=UPI00355A2F2B|nr:hypothetical protein MONOS_3142 [Monocercomonoides exilis]|eukprot:MONOS_3142.1-p1 / transcript=MONOS_3142.1 / gene=MONOS_3142 / organism=Monocercomonoides_exilis_PA203 / gene_product=unspecified product / transcript_product=unspecified product / location=Mono_scaffold00071:116115-117406(-) / protein_length=352 / sequence_SO=supercontig / SO=protein_coding / is_pseudo=false
MKSLDATHLVDDFYHTFVFTKSNLPPFSPVKAERMSKREISQDQTSPVEIGSSTIIEDFSKDKEIVKEREKKSEKCTKKEIKREKIVKKIKKERKESSSESDNSEEDSSDDESSVDESEEESTSSESEDSDSSDESSSGDKEGKKESKKKLKGIVDDIKVNFCGEIESGISSTPPSGNYNKKSHIISIISSSSSPIDIGKPLKKGIWRFDLYVTDTKDYFSSFCNLLVRGPVAAAKTKKEPQKVLQACPEGGLSITQQSGDGGSVSGLPRTDQWRSVGNQVGCEIDMKKHTFCMFVNRKKQGFIIKKLPECLRIQLMFLAPNVSVEITQFTKKKKPSPPKKVKHQVQVKWK